VVNAREKEFYINTRVSITMEKKGKKNDNDKPKMDKKQNPSLQGISAVCNNSGILSNKLVNRRNMEEAL
jgi:hypothetical protein